MTNAESAMTIDTSAHPNIESLRAVYADLTRLGEYASDDIVLHAAERSAADDGRHVGKQAVVAKEHELIRLTGNTLVMDAEHIIADDHFGAVLGVLRARLNGQNLAMPFCGLWRFRNGLVVEHWENAYDMSVMTQFFAQPSGALT